MPPWQLMRALDAVVSELPDQFVTCCYLVVDADAAELTVCSAGHLPLLLAAPSNAVNHSCGPVRLRVRQAGRELSVEVCDGSPVLPQARFASHDAESGRGLLLVDSLAEAWGTLPTAEGKAVWFSLPLPASARAKEKPYPHIDSGP
ncbi:SpoIIE family protein phosphatase [Streptomyces sp. NPDC059957]|uniref:ATP-binding protein n=1 Tax=unclassified Streptomyces TaxID=2593676 RepID=UPI00364C79D7